MTSARSFHRSVPWIYNDKSKSIEMDQLCLVMSKTSNLAVAIADSALFLPSFQYLVVRVPHTEANVRMCYSDFWLNSGHHLIKLKIKINWSEFSWGFCLQNSLQVSHPTCCVQELKVGWAQEMVASKNNHPVAIKTYVDKTENVDEAPKDWRKWGVGVCIHSFPF